MSNSILLVEEYIFVEKENDLVLIFDKDYIKPQKENNHDICIKTQKYTFVFKDTSELPLEKIKSLSTIPIVLNVSKDNQDKPYILEGTLIYQ